MNIIRTNEQEMKKKIKEVAIIKRKQWKSGKPERQHQARLLKIQREKKEQQEWEEGNKIRQKIRAYKKLAKYCEKARDVSILLPIGISRPPAEAYWWDDSGNYYKKGNGEGEKRWDGELCPHCKAILKTDKLRETWTAPIDEEWTRVIRYYKCTKCDYEYAHIHSNYVVNGCGYCFIATACYGTPLAPELDILRNFRDIALTPNNIGRWFVETYYKHSPPIADYISRHEKLRYAIRIILIKPAIKFVSNYLEKIREIDRKKYVSQNTSNTTGEGDKKRNLKSYLLFWH